MVLDNYLRAKFELFNYLVDQCVLYKEAIKYYANILTPFSKILRKNWKK